jgi:hypothetical protein
VNKEGWEKLWSNPICREQEKEAEPAKQTKKEPMKFREKTGMYGFQSQVKEEMINYIKNSSKVKREYKR